MSRIGRGSLLAFAFFIGLAPAGGAVRPAGAATPALEGVMGAAEAVFADEIRGTVIFNGCVVDPAKVSIRAEPLAVKTRTGYVFPRWRSTTGTALIKRTTDAHVLTFSIRGLSTRTPYQLGINFPPNPCGKMFWRGPEQGLALTGSRAVRLEGFSAQTQLEIRSTETGGFVGADELDFADAGAASRQLRWRSFLPGVTGGELQLSTEPFPRQGAFRTCDEPATGVFYRQQVDAPVRGRWQALEPIDFAPLLAPPGRVPPDIPGLTPISAATHGLLLVGAPVYLRIVPLVGGEPACDTRRHGVAGWVIAARRPRGDFDMPPDPPELPLLIALNGQSYTPPYFSAWTQGHPRYGELAYRAIKPHTFPPKNPNDMTPIEYWNYSIADPMGMMLLTCNSAKPGETWQPGRWFSYYPKSSGGGGGFFSGFTSVLSGLATGTWTAVGDFVDFMAKLTEQVKASLAKAVVNIATVVPGVSGACAGLQGVTGKSCEDVVKMGMEYGLTSVGIPPSLPNWKQLQDQGIDYLAAEVSTQIGDPTGLSEQFTQQMLTDMVNKTLNNVNDARPGLGATADWLAPFLGIDPAVWTLSVFNTDPNYHPQGTYIRVKAGNGLYQPVNVKVPERFPPGGLVRIPVALHPSKEGILAPLCSYDRYTDSKKCEPNSLSKVPVCRTKNYNSQTGKYQWDAFDCQFSDWPAIYYRDTWILNKLLPTTCVFLGGYSASDTGGLWLVNPNPPFADAAYLPPMVPATWDGATFVSGACP